MVIKECINGVYSERELSPSEIADMKAQAVKTEYRTTNHTFKEVK